MTEGVLYMLCGMVADALSQGYKPYPWRHQA